MPATDVDTKLQHMIEQLEQYADHLEADELEAALEAADAIGSDDGEGCPICERLSSSLAAAVAHIKWFPDTAETERIAADTADRARSEADDLRDEI